MKRTQKIEIRVSKVEYLIIKNKAHSSGNSVSEFMRGMALDYTLNYKLTEEELMVYRMLIDYKNHFIHIGNLFKLGDHFSVKERTVELAELIKNHLKKLDI